MAKAARKRIFGFLWLAIVFALLWVYLLRPISPRTGPTPVQLNDGWAVETDVNAHFNPTALRHAIEALLDGSFNVHSIIVERHGRLVAEYYQGGRDNSLYGLVGARHSFSATDMHDVRSIGKSVTGLLVGIAQEQGAIAELSSPVLTLYPELQDLATPEKQNITLENLLDMSSGLRWREGSGTFNDELNLMWKRDIPRYVLSHDIETPPGSRYNYNGGGTALLADLITRTTKQPLDEFARKHLFEPLGIRDWEWVGDLHGRPMSFSGLRMRPRDLLKLGRLMLDKGRWGNLQVVPAAWVEKSLTPKFVTDVSDFKYAKQWWAGSVTWKDKALSWHAGFGNGGQRLFIVPELDLAIVTTAGAYGELPTAIAVNKLLQAIVDTAK